MNYYNENDPRAAAVLRGLILSGLIPRGDVDERSIVDVFGADLTGYSQCHFFAGIGGWSEALWLSGWPESEPVWTGSCPCQPFSAAGKGKGEQDSRHLWPHFRRLIAERKPAVVFGEQVTSKLGRRWFSGVRSDMEVLEYAVGASDLCSPCVRAPHIRQRLYWVAQSQHAERRAQFQAQGTWSGRGRSGGNSITGGMVNSDEQRPQGRNLNRGHESGGPRGDQRITEPSGATGWLAEPDGGKSVDGHLQRGRKHGLQPHNAGVDPWAGYDILHCTDGKARRIEAGTFPLANGIPERMGRLRGYGNAIVPQVAAAFIKAYTECGF